MGLLSASGSFTRYKIIGDVPDSVFRELPERLGRNAFRDIDQTADERSYGWVSFDNWLDNGWVTAPPEKGGYIALTLRMDTRRISPAVFKKHFELAQAEAKNALAAGGEGPKFLSKDRKKELKEQVRLKLMARALPVPAIFDVAWNIKTQQVYLATTNSKVRLLFEDLFTMTFDLQLEPQAPFFLAVNLLGQEAESRLEALEPSDFMPDMD